MNKKVAWLVALLFLAAGTLAQGQQTNKVPRIGYLSSNSPASESARTETLRQGLLELGYVEGKNIVIEWRYAEGKLGRLSALAADLVRLKVDVIVTGGTGSTRSANEATNTIPIVMTQDPDPVGNGYVASLARHGVSSARLSAFPPEVSGKRLELLKEIIPKLSRVAVLGTSTNASNAQSLRETELAAGALAVKLQSLDVRGPKEIEPAFRAATKERADAVLLLGGPVLAS